MYLTFILFVLYAAYTEAACPDIQSAANLNMTAFASGIWSDLARYPNQFETAEECLSLKYSLNGDVFRFDSINVPENKRNFISVLGKVQPDNKIIVNASLGYPRQNFEVTMNVIFVDDDNKYAIKYNCINDDNNNTKEYAWILGRSTTLEGSDKEKLFKYIKSTNFIDMNKLLWIKYSDELCNQQ